MNLGMETEQVEFKRSTAELKEGIASIVSILNKHGGGTLYFGVKPNGDVVGQDVAESTLREISQAVGNSIEPRITPSIEVRGDGEGRSYIVVEFSGKDAPYACKGMYRVRTADEDVTMTAEQLERLIASRMNRKAPWDRRPSHRSLEDVDEDVLRAYVERGNKCGRIPFSFSNAIDVLGRLGLLVDGRLSNAADVLFCPSVAVQLKMGILESHSRTEILDLRQEKGTVFELVDKASVYVLTNTRRRFLIKEDGPRDEIPELPRLAVKEILMNAYAHRDWTLGGCVTLDVFYDSVEVLSPGWFIEGQDPEEHLKETNLSSITRNELIAETLFRSKDIESYGTGIPRVRNLCSQNGINVEYRREANNTRFIFHRNDAFAGSFSLATAESPILSDKRPILSDKRPAMPEWDLLSANERHVCDFMRKSGPAKTAQIAELLGITQRSALRIMRKLVDLGIVESYGSNRNRMYSFKQ